MVQRVQIRGNDDSKTDGRKPGDPTVIPGESVKIFPRTMQYLLGGKASSKVTARMMDASEITF